MTKNELLVGTLIILGLIAVTGLAASRITLRNEYNWCIMNCTSTDRDCVCPCMVMHGSSVENEFCGVSDYGGGFIVPYVEEAPK